MTDTQQVSEAIVAALEFQAEARHRSDEPATADEVDREAVATLAGAASIAAAVLNISGLEPVPLGADLAPTAPPLAGLAEVWRHYVDRRADAAGLRLGPARGGLTVVAVHATASAWADWVRANGVERTTRDHDGPSWSRYRADHHALHPGLSTSSPAKRSIEAPLPPSKTSSPPSRPTSTDGTTAAQPFVWDQDPRRDPRQSTP